MRRSTAIPFLAAIMILAPCAPAVASGLGGEVDYAHSEGRDGTEIGAGYAFSLSGFSLTPGAGVYLHGGDSKVYGRVEAAYTLPASLTVGVGLRIENEARPYATVAFPLLPKVAIKGNVGAHYYGIGVRIGY